MDIKQLDAMNAYAQAARTGTSGLTGRDGDDGLSAIGAQGSAFGSMVDGVIGDVAKTSGSMETVGVQSLVNQADLVDVVTAVSNAEMVVDTVVTVRDKVLNAYNEILKMPI
ncbi:flagellar hook-basal body complex protein FliE [Pseudokordiimonas caeni]|uniref:flagellar hook-basal body complex protein FliE n=1 Tax=Pseudokordiimonas caeni TaxID=2997908 RepID=UPI002811274F|nr:flagellar hook-basal body complex protein FliE [Pseudokordiimonas caeni]